MIRTLMTSAKTLALATALSTAGFTAAQADGHGARVRFALILRIVMRRTPVSVRLAWLVMVLFVPLFGPIAYILLAERRTVA